MPNYCQCFLKVSDYEGDFDRWPEFSESIKGDGGELLSFDKIIPYPAEWKELDRKWEEQFQVWQKTGRDFPQFKNGYNNGGYEWCHENWGTKWDAGDFEDVNNGYDPVIYKFTTAWAPPLPVILKLSEMWPSLTFVIEYYESGMEFGGCVSFQGGKQTRKVEFEYFGHMGG